MSQSPYGEASLATLLMAELAFRLLAEVKREGGGTWTLKGRELELYADEVMSLEGKAVIVRDWIRVDGAVTVKGLKSLESGGLYYIRHFTSAGYTEVKLGEEAVIITENWGSLDYWDQWVIRPQKEGWEVKYTGTVDGARYWPTFITKALEAVK